LKIIKSWKQNNDLQQTLAAIGRATLAIEYFARHTAHVVVVVPGQFRARPDVGRGEKRHPGEPQIVRVDKHVLDEQIRVTRVLEGKRKPVRPEQNHLKGATYVKVATNVARLLGVHDVNVLALAKHSTNRSGRKKTRIGTAVCR
jgi:hypothetical protein